LTGAPFLSQSCVMPNEFDNRRQKRFRIPIFAPSTRPPAGAAVWARRIVVWGVTVGACLWAAISCAHVLFGRSPTAATTPVSVGSRAAAPVSEPAAENPYAQQQALFDAGTKLLRTGDLSGMATLEQVVKSFPDSPQARKAMLAMAATYRYMENKPDEALNLYIEFVKRYPEDLQVTNAVGRMRELFQQLNVTDISERLVRDALAKVENNPQATERLNKLLEPPPQPNVKADTRQSSPAPGGAAVPLGGQPPAAAGAPVPVEGQTPAPAGPNAPTAVTPAP